MLAAYCSLTGFCTQEGSGGERVLQQMAVLAGRGPIAGLVVLARDVNSGEYCAAAKDFAGKAGQAAPWSKRDHTLPNVAVPYSPERS